MWFGPVSVQNVARHSTPRWLGESDDEQDEEEQDELEDQLDVSVFPRSKSDWEAFRFVLPRVLLPSAYCVLFTYRLYTHSGGYLKDDQNFTNNTNLKVVWPLYL